MFMFLALRAAWDVDSRSLQSEMRLLYITSFDLVFDLFSFILSSFFVSILFCERMGFSTWDEVLSVS